MTNEISTYFHDGMEIPFEDWSKKLHSFNDLTSIIPKIRNYHPIHD